MTHLEGIERDSKNSGTCIFEKTDKTSLCPQTHEDNQVKTENSLVWSLVRIYPKLINFYGCTWLWLFLASGNLLLVRARAALRLNFDSGSRLDFWFWLGFLARLLTLVQLLALESFTNDDVRRIL